MARSSLVTCTRCNRWRVGATGLVCLLLSLAAASVAAADQPDGVLRVCADPDKYGSVQSAEDLLKLPPDKLSKLRIGVFGRSPGSDWLLRHDLLEQAVMYAPQSGEVSENPAHIIERDLSEGKIDVAILWGP